MTGGGCRPRAWAVGPGQWTVIGLLHSGARGFTAYDCSNSTNRVDVYSFLEPAACHTAEHHSEVELWVCSCVGVLLLQVCFCSGYFSTLLLMVFPCYV